VLGEVTPEERDAIRALYERKNGLQELFRSLIAVSREELERGGLYDKLVADMSRTAGLFKQWWDTTSAKYGWVSRGDHKWEIDFETRSVFLQRQ
jgi:CXXX repeat modification system protein